MSEVNPNVDVSTETTAATAPTPSSTPLEISSSSGVSFDALEKALATPAPKAEKVTKAVETASTTPKEGDVTPKEATAVKTEAASADVEATPAAKSIKVKVGPRGREMELDLDMKIPTTVDGVEQEATLQDLRNDYSGRQATAKRFSELDARDKSYKADKEATEGQLNSILTKAYNKDPMGAVLEIVNLAKLDPGPVFEGIRDQLVGDITKFVNMSPVERDLHFKNLENQFLRGFKESVEKATTTRQADEALKTEIATMRDTLGLTDEMISQAQKAAETNEAYKQFKGDQKGIIRLADVLKRWDLAKDALSSIDPDFAANPHMIDLLSRELQGQPKATKEQAIAMVRKTLKLDSVKAPETKIPESLTKKVAGAPREVEQAITPNDSDFDPRGWGRI